MAFQFGFAADAGSEDEDETVPSKPDVPSAAADAPGVPAVVHKLEDLVGRSILSLLCITSLYRDPQTKIHSKTVPPGRIIPGVLSLTVVSLPTCQRD